MMHAWRWIRRLIPRWDDPLRSLQVSCGYWIAFAGYIPRDLLGDTEQTPQRDVIELPPGHPERMTEYQPVSAAERELWAALDGIDW